MIHFQGRQICQNRFYYLSKKGSSLKKKNLFLLQLNLFPFRVEPFSEGIRFVGKKTERSKSCLPCKTAEKFPRVSSSP